ncbi:MAG: 50S ribosomal protein L18 [Patescibacteria group bacterium]
MKKLQGRLKRHKIIRKKVSGTKIRPRLSVFRSNKDIYVQIIDDDKSETIIGMSTKVVKDGKDKTERSYNLGVEFGKIAVSKGIKSVVFDRGGYRFHGRVKSFSDGAKEGGLIF